MKKIACVFLILCMALPCLPAMAAEDADLSGYTTRQLIMQKIMVSVRRWSDADPADGDARKEIPALTEMNESVRAFFAEYQPGGVILFAENTQETDKTNKLIRDMQYAVTESGAPAMLVAVDQEGGRITRLAQGTSMPGNMALGATGDPENARRAARAMGEELYALGFTLDCAPSLDVNCNPANPVINVRSFGEDPEQVARFGTAYIEGMREAGVVSVVKHFPGHGDTQTDSHSSLPLVDKPLDEITRTELTPFRAAIDAGVQVVMTAHIQYPALDDTTAVSASTGEAVRLPATLSEKILTGLLRGEMGFQGVIMTDAMNMEAIALHFGVGDALTRAFCAGVDIALMPVEIMCPDDVAVFETAVSEVEDAVDEGRLSRDALEASVRRILRLKEECGAARFDERDAETARAVVASAEHRAVERELADASVTVLADDGVLPIAPREGDTLLLCAAYENEATALRFGVERLMSEGKIPRIRIEEYVYKAREGVDEELSAMIARVDAAILDSEIGTIARLAEGNWQSDMPLAIVAALNARGIPYCDISVLLPEDAALLTDARALVAIYNPSGMSDDAYRDARYAYGAGLPAAVDVIFGAAQPRGVLPVTIYALNAAREPDRNTVLYPCGYAK